MSTQSQRVCRTYGRHRLRRFYSISDVSQNLSGGLDSSDLSEDKSVLIDNQQSSHADFFAVLSKSLSHYEPNEQNTHYLDSSSLSEVIEASNCSSLLFQSISKLPKNVEDFQYYKENGIKKNCTNVRKANITKNPNLKKVKKNRKNKLCVVTDATQKSDVEHQPIDFSEIEQYSLVVEKGKSEASHKRKPLGIDNSHLKRLVLKKKRVSVSHESSIHELSSVTCPKLASAEPSPILKDALRGLQLANWKSSGDSPILRNSHLMIGKSSFKSHNVKTSTPCISRFPTKGKGALIGVTEQLSRAFPGNSTEKLVRNSKNFSKVVPTPVVSKGAGHLLANLDESWQNESDYRDSCCGSESLNESDSVSLLSKSDILSTDKVTKRHSRSSGMPKFPTLNMNLSAELFPSHGQQMPNITRIDSLDADKRLIAVDKDCLDKLSYICQSSKVSKTCGEGSGICKPCTVNLTPLYIRPEIPAEVEYSAEKHVLDICSQDKPVGFSTAFDATVLNDCVKIGEGVYGEVFRLLKENGTRSALKIIPIEGSFNVNGETQKSFTEILPEVVITKKLSDLREQFHNCTKNFIHIQKVVCLKGKYPPELLQEWDKFNLAKESENDRPDIFKDDQLFIALECADGGMDLESVQLKNADEAVSIFLQVSCSLAVAEQAVQFEHRDLHWGNILVSQCAEATLEYTLNGQDFSLPSSGVFTSVIDFTLSRLGKDGRVVFTDLSQDPSLFTGEGDYQYEIYRKIKDLNQNNWENFSPYSNILWLHYLVDKLCNEKEYKNKKSKKHKSAKKQLTVWKDTLLQYKSATDFISKSGIFGDTDLLDKQIMSDSFNSNRKKNCLRSVNQINLFSDKTGSRKPSVNSSLKRKKTLSTGTVKNIVPNGRAIRGSIRKRKNPNTANLISQKAYKCRV